MVRRLGVDIRHCVCKKKQGCSLLPRLRPWLRRRFVWGAVSWVVVYWYGSAKGHLIYSVVRCPDS